MLDGNVVTTFNPSVSFLQDDSIFFPVVRYASPNMSTVWGVSPFVSPIIVGIFSGGLNKVSSGSSLQQTWIADYTFTGRLVTRAKLVFTMKFPVVPALWVIGGVGCYVKLEMLSLGVLVSTQTINLTALDLAVTKTIDLTITSQTIDQVRALYVLGGTGAGSLYEQMAGWTIETTQFYIYEESEGGGGGGGSEDILSQPVTSKACIVNSVSSASCLTVGQASKSDIL